MVAKGHWCDIFQILDEDLKEFLIVLIVIKNNT
jgi:hypothetical protein